jgi:cytochrome P450
MAEALPKASVRDTLAVATEVFLPTLAQGVILRRPKVVAMAERLQLDGKAVRCLQRLRHRYGDGPLMLRMPGRSQAIVLSLEHVQRVLDETPDPFASASTEKQAALAHFQPHGVLVSDGAVRAERRRVNEAVLETECPRHRFAERFAAVVQDEAAELVGRAQRALTWELYTRSWFRVVRRVVLGDAARDDAVLTDMLARLRRDANWAFLHPRRRRLRERFVERLTAHVRRAEPESLAGLVAAYPAGADADPIGQMPQWLFAFDAAGIASFRALAVLSTHPHAAEHAQAEIQRSSGSSPPLLPFLRACVLESVRLWPTTPMILRQTSAETKWSGAAMPKDTGVLIYVPFFHRDDTRLPFAHRFAPEQWMGGAAPERSALIPFSAGPAVCAGQQLVLLLTSLMLASLLRDRELRLESPAPLNTHRPLPATLNNFSLRFSIRDRTPTFVRSHSPSAA